MRRFFKRRPAAEYRVCTQALIGIMAVRLLLVCIPLRSVRRGVWHVLSAGRPLPISKRLPLHRVVRCAARSARFSPVPSTCLVTALVTEALLSRHGYRAHLRVGVQRQGGEFAAHAWLEFQGSVVVGGPVEMVKQYTPLPEIERLLV